MCYLEDNCFAIVFPFFQTFRCYLHVILGVIGPLGALSFPRWRSTRAWRWQIAGAWVSTKAEWDPLRWYVITLETSTYIYHMIYISQPPAGPPVILKQRAGGHEQGTAATRTTATGAAATTAMVAATAATAATARAGATAISTVALEFDQESCNVCEGWGCRFRLDSLWR